MPKQRSKETSPVYGSFLVSMLYRSVGYLSPGGKAAPYGATMDKALASVFEAPEIEEIAGTALEKLNATSDAEWVRGVRKIFSLLFKMFSNLYRESGEPDPPKGMRLDAKLNLFLDKIGYEYRFKDLALWVKRWLKNLLELIVSGQKEAVVKWARYTTAGLFEEDPEKAVATIRICFLASGGDKLVQEMDDAVRLVRDRLILSPEFRAAVELVEKRQQWGGSESDSRFTESWEGLKPRTMGRIIRKGLAIPEIGALSDDGKKNWNEEESLATISVYKELLRRASENPTKLIADAWNGRLANSLVLSAENDLKDEIRRLRAQKRDVTKEEALDEEYTLGSRKTSPQPTAGSKDPLQKITEEDSYSQIMNLLSEDEKRVAEMLQEGLTQREIASRLGKSQPWVSGKIRDIREKLEPFSK